MLLRGQRPWKCINNENTLIINLNVNCFEVIDYRKASKMTDLLIFKFDLKMTINGFEVRDHRRVPYNNLNNINRGIIEVNNNHKSVHGQRLS